MTMPTDTPPSEPDAALVEQVARALCDVATENARRFTGNSALDAIYGWQDFVPDARAVLAIPALAERADVARLREALTAMLKRFGHFSYPEVKQAADALAASGGDGK